MFEIPSKTLSPGAIRRAHEERSRVFAAVIWRVFHPFAK
ncbi:MAG: hypothetical protein ACI9IV_001516 [Paracoccaceae bacterium]|jgi:hypothetical protein|tara:strand:+ start:423 stop:539 length:117 start_codon:yes stop_codon:yes gene_type:complete